MHVINVKSNVRDYRVHFPDNTDFIETFAKQTDCVFVIDSNVWQLHRNGCLRGLQEKNLIVFPVTEERKNLKSVEELYDNFVDRTVKKNMTVVSIGGGILQDITGFAATTLYRGINWIFVPTTLLAQADSCIGSKTSLNYKGFKNLIGTFYPPKDVYIYLPFLATIKDVDFYSGIGEVVKLHIMGGKQKTLQLIEMLPGIIQRKPESLMNIIVSSLKIKLKYIKGDEFDAGRRNLLNFGHCFGHALETVSGYAIPHGQAVIIGMLFANFAAEKRHLLRSATCDFLTRKLFVNTIKTKVKDSDLDCLRILNAMKKDKKRSGPGLAVIMMKNNYTFEKVTDFTREELAAAINELAGVLNSGTRPHHIECA